MALPLYEMKESSTEAENQDDGTKLKPMIIFKRKTMPKDEIRPGVLVHVHEKGWMDENGIQLWIKVWKCHPGDLHQK